MILVIGKKVTDFLPKKRDKVSIEILFVEMGGKLFEIFYFGYSLAPNFVKNQFRNKKN